MAKELVLIDNVWVIRTIVPTPTTTSERTVTYSYGSTVTQAEFGSVSNIKISSTTGSVA
jgi:hypothetical protein